MQTKYYSNVPINHPVIYFAKEDGHPRYFHFNINARGIMESTRRMVRKLDPLYTRESKGKTKQMYNRLKRTNDERF